LDEYGRKRIIPVDGRPENPEDQRILEFIERAFNESPDVNPTRVRIFVHSGHVTLVGTVSTLNQKFECEDLAHNTSGVHSVINDIEIKEPRRFKSSPINESEYR